MAPTRDAWESQPRPGARPATHPATVMRQTLLWASRRRWIKGMITAAPLTRALVQRFVAGEDLESAVAVARALTRRGLCVSLDHLGEDTRDAAAAGAALRAGLDLIARVRDLGLTPSTELSVKLSALGQAVDEAMATEYAATLCAAAEAAGTSVTVDMEDHSTTDATLRAVIQLRTEYPATGAVIQASLHRSPEDCAALAGPGSRVRLCKGAYQEPTSVAWQSRREVRSAYLRCLRVLAAGKAYPMVATHDPLLLDAARRLLPAVGREPHQYEYQMLYGIRPDEQRRLVAAGFRVRVYVPYGTQWYSYLMRRLAERPANLALVLRAVGSRG